MAGKLVLVATPIGNLGDLSPRAVEALADADVVACEDTRRTGKLLAHAGVSAPRLLVVNEHTEKASAAEIADLIVAGNIVALVTDAGTPAVSDPGAKVVQAVLKVGAEVEAVPGPSAALSVIPVGDRQAPGLGRKHGWKAGFGCHPDWQSGRPVPESGGGIGRR
ncbi:MAG: SAM-dependent methyltransferase [bacterium]|nr:SAM-dependent methyltransferase [bacterium]